MKKSILLLCLVIPFFSKAQITAVTVASGGSITQCTNFTIYYTSQSHVIQPTAQVWYGGVGGVLVATYSNVYQGQNITETASNFTPGSNYQIKVYDATIPSNYGWSSTFSVLQIPAPVATGAASVTCSSFYVNWNTVVGASQYYFDVSSDNFSTFLTYYNNLGSSTTSAYVNSGVTCGMTYYYRVRAAMGSCTSVSSNVVTVTTPPAVPTLACPTQITSTSFAISWTSINSATQYYLDYSNNGFATYIRDILTSTSDNLSNLQLNASYSVRVSAINSVGTSSGYSTTTTVGLIAAPSASAASSIGTASFQANWNYTFHSYFVDISTDPNFGVGNFIGIYNNYNFNYPQLSVSGSGFQPNSTYYYRVRGGLACGITVNSNVITVLTIPSAPIATGPTNIQGTYFTANWQSVPSITQYQVQVATDVAFTNVVYQTITTQLTSFDIPTNTLTTNTQYYYRIGAKNATGFSSPSNVFGPFYTAPTAPINISTSAVTLNSFIIGWNSVPNATTYQIDINTSSSFSPEMPGFPIQVNALTYQVTGLNPCTAYYYRVLTENPTPSAYSTTYSQLTAPPTPIIPTPSWQNNLLAATNITPTSFTANWSPVTGCANMNYNLYVYYSGPNYLCNPCNTGVNTFDAFSGLNSGYTYSYYVKAAVSNGLIQSAQSNLWTVNLSNITPTTNPAGNVGSSAFIASWSAISGTTGYLLDVSTSSAFANFILQNYYYDGTQFSPTGLNPSTTYYYRVRSITTQGYSTYSNVQSLTTTASGPPGGRVGVITGVSNEANNGIAVFPNPASTSVTISLPNVLNEQSIQTTINDLFGRSLQGPVVYSDNNLKVDVSSLSNGMYLILLSFDNYKFVGKIIKQ